MHLRNACSRFTKNKERIKKFKETRYSSCIYQNELNKAFINMIWLVDVLKI